MIRELFKCEFGKICYAGWEWLVMRIAFCILLWPATFHNWSLMPQNIRDSVDQEQGNGLAGLFNLEWIGASPMEWIAQYLFLGFLIVYATGKWQLFASAGLLVLHSLIGGIFASPAKDHHATQVVGIALLGQFLWFSWEFLRTKKAFANCCGNGGEQALDRSTGAIFFSQQGIAAAYVVSAISKWVNSGGGIIPGAKWIAQTQNIPVQMEKNNLQAFYDHLQMPENAELNQRSIDFVINSPNIAMIFFATAFYLEFLAIFAIWNRKISALFGIGLICMHLGIAAVMHLQFWYFEAIVLVFFVNIPFWAKKFGTKQQG